MGFLKSLLKQAIIEAVIGGLETVPPVEVFNQILSHDEIEELKAEAIKLVAAVKMTGVSEAGDASDMGLIRLAMILSHMGDVLAHNIEDPDNPACDCSNCKERRKRNESNIVH